jgi:hypothetical protein
MALPRCRFLADQAEWRHMNEESGQTVHKTFKYKLKPTPE